MRFLQWFFFGAILGLFQFLSQRWTVNHLSPDSRRLGLFWVVAGCSVRLALAVLLLLAAFNAGFIPGLLAFTGMILMRWLVLIRNER